MKRCLNCMEEYREGSRCPHCGYVEGTSPKEVYHLAPGTVLYGRYIVGTSAGAGGFGVVYRAWDTTLEKMVAIKEYYPPSIVSRVPGTKEVYVYAKKREAEYRKGLDSFLEEAQIMAKFSTHPKIVNVYNFFEENNTAYYVMEYIHGVSLKEYIRANDGVLQEEEAKRIILAILDALSDVHKEGIIHRDIAPDNIFICNDGKVKVNDFGLAVYISMPISEEKHAVKPGISPPEQYSKTSKQEMYTDIYATAAMLYRAVAGVMPEESINRIREDGLVPPRDLNPIITENLNNAILRGMAVQPELRFQTAAEFKTALEADKKVLDDKAELKRRKKRRVISIAASILILILGIGGGLFAYNNMRSAGEIKDATLTMWVPAPAGEEENVESAYRKLIIGFRELYPQVVINVEAIDEDDYESRLKKAASEDNLPELYECSSLGQVYDALSLQDVISELDVNEYHGLKTYLNSTKVWDKLPISFQREAVYVNRLLTDETVTTKDLENISAADNTVEKFLNGKAEYILSDTSCYHQINVEMTGKYEMYSVPEDMEESAYYDTALAVSANSTKDERKAAYRFLEYALTYNAQIIFCVQNNGGLPLQKEAYDDFIDTNLEFNVFEGTRVPTITWAK